MKRLENIYHTDNASDDEIIEHFTIRKNEFELIMNSINSQKKQSLQSFLIIGKRGMGKSTLIRRIDIELKRNYKDKIIAVRLGNEGYRISRLYKLWEQIIDFLDLDYPQLKKEKEKLAESAAYEENIFLLINETIKKESKTLILLIDNFDVMIKNFNTKEQHLLREILIQYPVQIIGNTLFYQEHFFEYSQPFYDFFKIIQLKNLNPEESIQFIDSILTDEEKAGHILNGEKKLHTIRTLSTLSGGVPRTIVLLASVLFDKNLETTMDHLKKLIELVTPLYQDRMSHLSAQQREIMHALAMRWDKSGVKEIAKQIRTESKNVSAQLKSLELNGYIIKDDIPGRNHLYFIDERFFNIWLLMSEGSPYDGTRVLWLTRTLDTILDEEDIKQYARGCLGKLINKENQFLFVQALAQTNKLKKAHKISLLYAIDATEEPLTPEQDSWVKRKKAEIIEGSSEHEILYEEARALYENSEYSNAITFFEKIEPKNANVFAWMGYIYDLGLKDYVSAEKYYLMAIENKNVQAMFNLADMYLTEFKNFEKAEKYYLMAIENKNAEAMNNLAIMYKTEFKNFEKAEKYYLMAIENKNAGAMFNLALMYKAQFKNFEKAEKYYLMAIENKNAGAMFNLAKMYQTEFKNFEKAEKYYLMAIENKNAGAMFNLALLYQTEFKNFRKAEKYYLLAIDNKHTHAMHNLAVLHFEQNKKPQKALELINTVISIETNDLSPYFRTILLLWNGEIREATIAMTAILKIGQDKLEKMIDSILDVLTYFLVFKQKHTLYKFFSENIILKDMYKPLYFALLTELKDEKQKEYLTMSPELQEPVDILLKEINILREKYGI